MFNSYFHFAEIFHDQLYTFCFACLNYLNFDSFPTVEFFSLYILKFR